MSYKVLSYNNYQGVVNSEDLGDFESKDEAVSRVVDCVKEHGFNSKNEWFSVFNYGSVTPGGNARVFCTAENSSDLDMIIWWDESDLIDKPVFYCVSGQDMESGAFKDVVVCVGPTDGIEHLIDCESVFYFCETEDQFAECFKPGELTFVFEGDYTQVSVDDLMGLGII